MLWKIAIQNTPLTHQQDKALDLLREQTEGKPEWQNFDDDSSVHDPRSTAASSVGTPLAGESAPPKLKIFFKG